MNHTTEVLEGEIARFEQLIVRLNAVYSIEKVADYVFVIKPAESDSASFGAGSVSRDVHLTLMGSVHGVEVAGLAVLNKVLERLVSDSTLLAAPLGVAVGNVPAIRAKKRFIDRDLNRSFGRTSRETGEDRRADELEKLILRSRYMIDFHQVRLPSVSPFWIFPYHKEGFSFVRAVAADVPIVTHWQGGFSQDGQCSDEFLIKNGSCGVSIELGQCGFDSVQIDLGFRVALAGIREARMRVLGETRGPRLDHGVSKIYTWGEIVPYPHTGLRVLDEGWSNFAFVKAGQRLGEFNGQTITSKNSGWILFPKYPDQSSPTIPPAAELVRILKEVSEAELPK
jgi:hypothetical protein